ncbi:YihY/virulence factor BrkB family protein [Staphylococcus massiliensis]|uniref:Ribonuclease BN-like family protein n=1 Tax=Staphylococcus massiliensis S46 TaxID=1229783 RepID=K9AHQ9_9STAP|nr:YihY/virulence factor BrkB family protein [Staphylococcus massiliensis]EKU46833.1 ribonuclease BN-like family protein [Staphylococcus massiliensis S46]MCG3399952.1 YihY/virulence factor BrkB family protein [Staphylococcus massiliensis]MCG3402671.1 YihY/virulence factor BrkB family protein [Staphylococcus massiliensis]MCG3412918.1 YihY/virulence factor BrkB family protein [Staphylococcus massiliensis]POA01572.1 YihY/virulence factor BrkB family protein [Staphylococcus massiliensis CCUG 55927
MSKDKYDSHIDSNNESNINEGNNQTQTLSDEEKNKKEGPEKGLETKKRMVYPIKFNTKTSKKDDITFFTSKINKPAKYKRGSGILPTLIYRIGKDDVSGLAAQLAYYFMLSLFPMLIFLLTLLPVFQVDTKKITNLISENAPADTASLLTGIIEDVMQNASGGLLSFGLIAALWSASNGMTALMNAFNVAYDVEDNRNPILLKLLSVVFTVIISLVLAVSMVLPAFGQQIGALLFGPLGLDSAVRWVFSIVRFLLPFILLLVVFSTLYALAPNIKVKLRSVLPGALFTSVVWILATLAFGFFVSNFGNYSKTYGSIGSIIVLMLWLYLTGFIIILGAELNAIIHQRKYVKGKVPEEEQFDDILKTYKK